MGETSRNGLAAIPVRDGWGEVLHLADVDSVALAQMLELQGLVGSTCDLVPRCPIVAGRRDLPSVELAGIVGKAGLP